ncbi:hypothetical protein DY000_02017495 [Brassica cretica]|uniref:Uncharacterized protein n=1 Tax=Brassica cretica TaxID=69181 RepID=A0ABQ7DAL0_BRACR|nr:hypothetical protein DY000_02017495 [Brassica cretica]
MELDVDVFLFSRLELPGELQRLVGINLNPDLLLCSIDHVHFPKSITNSFQVLMSAEVQGNALELDPKRHHRWRSLPKSQAVIFSDIPHCSGIATQLVTACPVGMLLKGEVLGSRLTNNLIMELERTYNGGVGVGALQRLGMMLKGEVLGLRLTNNLIMELERTHNGGVGVGALQRCEPGAHGADCRNRTTKREPRAGQERMRAGLMLRTRTNCYRGCSSASIGNAHLRDGAEIVGCELVLRERELAEIVGVLS